jgi:hypothetical protein
MNLDRTTQQVPDLPNRQASGYLRDGRNAMRLMMFMLFTTSLLACAGCDGNGSAQGGGTGNNGHGLVKIGVPF